MLHYIAYFLNSMLVLTKMLWLLGLVPHLTPDQWPHCGTYIPQIPVETAMLDLMYNLKHDWWKSFLLPNQHSQDTEVSRTIICKVIRIVVQQSSSSVWFPLFFSWCKQRTLATQSLMTSLEATPHCLRTTISEINRLYSELVIFLLLQSSFQGAW